MNEPSVFENEGWYHIVVNTASNIANSTCYINGVLMTTKARVNNFIASANTKLSIGGSSYYGATYTCRQKIDIFRAFNRHLTQEDVVALKGEYDKAGGFYLYHNLLSTIVSAKHQFRVLNFPLPNFLTNVEVLNSGLEERDIYMYNRQLLTK